MIDLRLGRYQEALADVSEVDAVITDPPYGKRVHTGHDAAADQVRSATGQKVRRDLNYAAWGPADVHEFVQSWAPRCSGWMVALTSDDLIASWREAYAAVGRLDFAPVGVLTYHPRLLGDGPGSGLIYAMVSRPRTREAMRWRCLPPWYGPFYPGGKGGVAHIGGKPIELMRLIVADYSNPGQLVCDPCAGAATTLLAARDLGRRSVGAECDPDTFAAAQGLTAQAFRPRLFEQGPASVAVERNLFGERGCD